MGRLAGLTYHGVVSRLKRLGFGFDRSARGNHEIWWDPQTQQGTGVLDAVRTPVGRTHEDAESHAGLPDDRSNGALRQIFRMAWDRHTETFLGT